MAGGLGDRGDEHGRDFNANGEHSTDSGSDRYDGNGKDDGEIVEDSAEGGGMRSAQNRDFHLAVAAGHMFAMKTLLFLQTQDERTAASRAALEAVATASACMLCYACMLRARRACPDCVLVICVPNGCTCACLDGHWTCHAFLALAKWSNHITPSEACTLSNNDMLGLVCISCERHLSE